jgi:NADH:ubiquinone oxidoreductase subunit D
LRKVEPYEAYSKTPFKIVISNGIGDCYDRFKVRIGELKQSLIIIESCLSQVCTGAIKSYDHKISSLENAKLKYSMEALIHHFKYYTEGLLVPAGRTYVGVEAPKGEFGSFVISNGVSSVYRNKIRAPGYLHLQGLNFMVKNHLIADLVTVIGTQDIVFGEVDR